MIWLYLKSIIQTKNIFSSKEHIVIMDESFFRRSDQNQKHIAVISSKL